MIVSPKIKVCGMREPENVAGIAVLGIDYMGFIFYPKSPRFVGENYNAKELIGLTGDIKRTGVFVNASLEYIKSQVEKLALKAVQLHGNETPGLCEQVKDLQVEVIKAVITSYSIHYTKLYEYRFDGLSSRRTMCVTFASCRPQ